MAIKVTVKDRATPDLKRLAKEMPVAFEKAILREAMRILQASLPLVPVDTGRLRNSGGAGIVNGQAVVFYGTDYSLIVHEGHRTHSKFLEKPFREALSGMTDRIARDVRRLARLG